MQNFPWNILERLRNHGCVSLFAFRTSRLPNLEVKNDSKVTKTEQGAVFLTLLKVFGSSRGLGMFYKLSL